MPSTVNGGAAAAALLVLVLVLVLVLESPGAAATAAEPRFRDVPTGASCDAIERIETARGGRLRGGSSSRRLFRLPAATAKFTDAGYRCDDDRWSQHLWRDHRDSEAALQQFRALQTRLTRTLGEPDFDGPALGIWWRFVMWLRAALDDRQAPRPSWVTWRLDGVDVLLDRRELGDGRQRVVLLRETAQG